MDAKFVERLNIIKVSYDLTYSRLAQILGVSDDTAGNYFTGRTAMSIDKALSLSAALRIDPNWLLRGIGDSPIKSLNQIHEPSDNYGVIPKIDQYDQKKSIIASGEALISLIEKVNELERRISDLEKK